MAEQARLRAEGKYISQAWKEIVDSARKPADRRSAEEIVADVVKGAGLEVV